ncbi:hypothetical protein FQA47_001948 [Oryzias melastigma]|uniref:Uncharacterized protein n=1 Tax=Oryzias melastigma TaxID=30732 RepID=A0A834FA41_ORYME|nr:hypothetical protein FQA47_001948 [Oryzias melastigma]
MCTHLNCASISGVSPVMQGGGTRLCFWFLRMQACVHLKLFLSAAFYLCIFRLCLFASAAITTHSFNLALSCDEAEVIGNFRMKLSALLLPGDAEFVQSCLPFPTAACNVS